MRCLIIFNDVMWKYLNYVGWCRWRPPKKVSNVYICWPTSNPELIHEKKIPFAFLKHFIFGKSETIFETIVDLVVVNSGPLKNMFNNSSHFFGRCIWQTLIFFFRFQIILALEPHWCWEYTTILWPRTHNLDALLRR